LEFAGPGLAVLSVPDRLTISNMAIEAGAKAGIFPSDEATQDYLSAMGRPFHYKPFTADANAVYEKTININLTTLEPTVSKPHTVDNTALAKDLRGTKYSRSIWAPALTAVWKT